MKAAISTTFVVVCASIGCTDRRQGERFVSVPILYVG